jgi:hypothetical protein
MDEPMKITHKITHNTLWGAAFTAALALPLALPAQAQPYSFTNFDGPVSTTAGATLVATTVNGLSNSGAVVGFTADNNNVSTNFGGTLGSLTPLNLPGTASANGINASGQVVGTNGTGSFLLNSLSPLGKPLPLPLVNGTTTAVAAFGINDSGEIVGQYTDSATGTSPGFVDVNGAYTTLSALPNATQTFAQGINNNGLVTGFFGTGGILTRGFLFDTNTNAYTVLADPNVANLSFTQFLGLNDTGEAVGYYGTTDNLQHGFLYHIASKTYTFLDDPNVAPGGSALMQITGIDNAGEIDGFFTDAAGTQRGFIANPVPEASTTVSFGLLLALGLGGVIWAAKKRTARGEGTAR